MKHPLYTVFVIPSVYGLNEILQFAINNVIKSAAAFDPMASFISGRLVIGRVEHILA